MLSSLPEANIFPSGLNGIEFIQEQCFLSYFICAPEYKFQIKIVLLAFPEANVFLSGLKYICPRIYLRFFLFQIISILLVPAASSNPSKLKEIEAND